MSLPACLESANSWSAEPPPRRTHLLVWALTEGPGGRPVTPDGPTQLLRWEPTGCSGVHHADGVYNGDYTYEDIVLKVISGNVLYMAIADPVPAPCLCATGGPCPRMPPSRDSELVRRVCEDWQRTLARGRGGL